MGFILLLQQKTMQADSYFRNWMFVLQRISGVITLIFIAWHVWETRIAAAFGKEVNFDMMADIVSSSFNVWFYIIGVVSAVFHFANGLWSFCVSWGITVSPRSQVISTYVTMVFFVVLIYCWNTCNFSICLIN